MKTTDFNAQNASDTAANLRIYAVELRHIQENMEDIAALSIGLCESPLINEEGRSCIRALLHRVLESESDSIPVIEGLEHMAECLDRTKQ